MSATLSGKPLISSELPELAERARSPERSRESFCSSCFANRKPVDLIRTSGSDHDLQALDLRNTHRAKTSDIRAGLSRLRLETSEHDATVKAARAFTTSETPERDFAPAEPSQKPS
jgi:hypothetical protein